MERRRSAGRLKGGTRTRTCVPARVRVRVCERVCVNVHAYLNPSPPASMGSGPKLSLRYDSDSIDSIELSVLGLWSDPEAVGKDSVASVAVRSLIRMAEGYAVNFFDPSDFDAEHPIVALALCARTPLLVCVCVCVCVCSHASRNVCTPTKHTHAQCYHLAAPWVNEGAPPTCSCTCRRVPMREGGRCLCVAPTAAAPLGQPRPRWTLWFLRGAWCPWKTPPMGN